MIAGRAPLRPRLVLGDETLAAGEARVGGKALGLGKLVAAGARVPAWLVVPVEVFADALDAAGLTERCERALAEGSSPGRAAAVAGELQALVGALTLPAPVARELGDALALLGPGPYAVRSSMVGEDSATRSFAGQLDSFLFLRGDEVAAGIVRCWRSAFGARALAYQLRAAPVLSLPRVAVVVQQTIEGRVSGVLFTSNPVNGARDESLVSAAFGLGEGVVSGACNADEYVWSQGGGERAATIAKKDTAIVRAKSGTGTEEIELPGERVEARTLSPAELGALCGEGLRVAAALGAPQDIEWTLAGDGLYLLQARPITARALCASDGPRVVWDNSNIQESYCGVTTPLTFSFAAECYASVYTQTLVALGVPPATVAAYEPVLRNLLGLVRGRVYYNINNWYRALLVLPSFGRNKHDMEQMMGLDSPIDFIADEVLSTAEGLRRLPRLGATAARLVVAFARLDGKVERFMAEFDATLARFDRKSFAGASLSRLMELREEARSSLIGRWHVPILNDLYVMMACGRLRRLVERAVGAARAPLLLSSLLAADEGVASVEPTRLLMRIAHTLRWTPPAVALLRRGTPLEALAALRAGHPEIGAQIDDYLARFGDRCMGELKLETVSLRQDPSFVVQVLRNYVDRADLDAGALAEHERARRQVAEAEVLAGLGAWRRRRFLRALARARQGIAAREAMRLARTRAFGLHRDLYLAVGERLREAGRLDTARDVFYLTVQEVAAYHDGTAVSADLAAIARARRAEFAAYEGDDLPNRFETVGPVHANAIAAPRTSAAERTASLLRGIGCSPGVVDAPLAVIASPDDDLALDGKILTALRTDPGWAPLFPSARAVLVERGSTLSHSAVLARELGIPAVVGVPNLLRIVRAGERVRLDGAAGTVERLERPC